MVLKYQVLFVKPSKTLTTKIFAKLCANDAQMTTLVYKEFKRNIRAAQTAETLDVSSLRRAASTCFTFSTTTLRPVGAFSSSACVSAQPWRGASASTGSTRACATWSASCPPSPSSSGPGRSSHRLVHRSVSAASLCSSYETDSWIVVFWSCWAVFMRFLKL